MAAVISFQSNKTLVHTSACRECVKVMNQKQTSLHQQGIAVVLSSRPLKQRLTIEIHFIHEQSTD